MSGGIGSVRRDVGDDRIGPGDIPSQRTAADAYRVSDDQLHRARMVVARNSALRDELAYPDPESIRFDRDGPQQLVFGGGPHYCLGAHLAKAELHLGLGLLLERLPTLRLDADPLDLSYTEGELLSSLVSLPVAW